LPRNMRGGARGTGKSCNLMIVMILPCSRGQHGLGLDSHMTGAFATQGMTRNALAGAVLALLTLLPSGHARAEDQQELRGVALVIGESDYQNIARLPNPGSDARAIEEMLDSLGFETDVATNRDARKLQRDLEGFVEDAEDAVGRDRSLAEEAVGACERALSILRDGGEGAARLTEANLARAAALLSELK
jgi:hypothetical protein